MTNAIIEEAQKHMQKSQDSLQRDLGKIRAGRANASILNGITVEYYGADLPINQVASISVPEARVLMITPFDKSALKNIEKALLKSDIGINPANDGSVIRLVIPQLTGERRQELSKEVGKISEMSKVSVRNIRREAIDKLKKQQKSGDITDDEFYDLEKQVQKVTDSNVKAIENIAEKKAQELVEG
ncbi:ribosome recycling factor [Lactobacillus mellis]|uniref:ribosome recycling factor n=1 Tax=Bombilactobacillus mellis TaxID=1218508 RepID=UPI00157FF67F|nr:ribosome recycling factor [Bombilactobacillus mellis]MBI0107741.1 ribosome recycling factor [Lactobacillus sp. W8086]MBI0109207.1 ribosome recycling factor [Lactobacillus sp. W8085]MBI0112408.1 ribosome recycling factor [Lactobacillus sp. W8088]MBI0116139.1 ribosome recycling factor [Lactobacillus sp. W8087]MBI0119849.1 ribosome recycling factor [Lactobacillus sp. W8089]MBI0131814.1 ribosome recycling factor [Lactobacillus sp. W8090]